MNDKEQRAGLFKIVKSMNLPMFILEHDPYKASTPVLGFARMDSYILKLAILIYSVRLKINEKGDSERFLWTSSEEAFAFISGMNHEEIIDLLIKGEISIRPVCELCDILSGKWKPNNNDGHYHLSRYLQLRYKQWRTA